MNEETKENAMDARPTWKHPLSEDDVRWLSSGVTKITHHWTMTGEDTSDDWIELHKEKGKRRFPSSFLNTNSYFEFKPNWRELVVPTWRGKQALEDLAAIEMWERKNAKERTEYERLKRKFSGAAPTPPSQT